MTFHCKISKHYSRGGHSAETVKRAAKCEQPFTSFTALAEHLVKVHRVGAKQLVQLARQHQEEQAQ